MDPTLTPVLGEGRRGIETRGVAALLPGVADLLDRADEIGDVALQSAEGGAQLAGDFAVGKLLYELHHEELPGLRREEVEDPAEAPVFVLQRGAARDRSAAAGKVIELHAAGPALAPRCNRHLPVARTLFDQEITFVEVTDAVLDHAVECVVDAAAVDFFQETIAVLHDG